MDEIEDIGNLPPEGDIDEKKLEIRTRQNANSFSEAALIISYLGDLWESWFPDRDFIDDVFKQVWDDEPIDLDDLNQQLKEIEESQEDAAGVRYTPELKLCDLRLAIHHISCACAVLAFQSGKDTPLSWSYVADANRWYGVLIGGITSSGLVSLSAASQLGRKGAEKKNAENKAIREEIFSWLDDNMKNYKSMNAAAQYIAGTVAPVAFDTARRTVGQWKKRRSTGTA